MGSKIAAVIFDCDGTLVDSEPISLRVFVDLVIAEGMQVDHEQAVREWAGCDLHEVMAEVERNIGRPLRSDFIDVFREKQMQRLAEQVTAIPGADRLLDSVEIPRAVASNAPQKKVRMCLEKVGLLNHFDTDRVFSAYDIKVWKPRPDLFLAVADQMGVAPEHCAVVEDSRFGVLAGLEAGMQVFAYDPSDELTDFSDATRVQELTQLVGKF